MGKGTQASYSPSAVGAGAGFSASGPVSGVATSSWTSGPWMIEEQDLTIAYTRVPYGVAQPNNNALTLADTSTVSVIGGTFLIAHVQASYSVTKSYSYYDSSTFQQPHTFVSLAASSDHLGLSYGTILAGSSLGPAGTLQTSTPWVNRRYWNDATDSEITQHADGYTFSIGRHLGLSSIPYVELDDQSNHMQNYDSFWIKPGGRHSHLHAYTGLGTGEFYCYQKDWILPKTGPFVTTQEGPLDMQYLVQYVSINVKAEKLKPSSFDVPRDQTQPYIDPDDQVGVPRYDRNRHQY